MHFSEVNTPEMMASMHGPIGATGVKYRVKKKMQRYIMEEK